MIPLMSITVVDCRLRLQVIIIIIKDNNKKICKAPFPSKYVQKRVIQCNNHVKKKVKAQMYIVSESRLVCLVHTYQMNRATHCKACILPGNLLLGLEFTGLVAFS